MWKCEISAKYGSHQRLITSQKLHSIKRANVSSIGETFIALNSFIVASIWPFLSSIIWKYLNVDFFLWPSVRSFIYNKFYKKIFMRTSSYIIESDIMNNVLNKTSLLLKKMIFSFYRKGAPFKKISNLWKLSLVAAIECVFHPPYPMKFI